MYYQIFLVLLAYVYGFVYPGVLSYSKIPENATMFRSSTRKISIAAMIVGYLSLVVFLLGVFTAQTLVVVLGLLVGMVYF